jgi:hypothetical protein
MFPQKGNTITPVSDFAVENKTAKPEEYQAKDKRAPLPQYGSTPPAVRFHLRAAVERLVHSPKTLRQAHSPLAE